MKAVSDAWTQNWLFRSASRGLSVIYTITFLFSSFCTKYHTMEHITKLSISWVHTTRTTWEFSNRTYGHWKMLIYQKWNIENTISVTFFFFLRRRKGMIFYNQVNIASSVLNLLGSFLLFGWNCTIENKNKRRSQSKCSELLMNYQLIFFWSKIMGTYARKWKTNKQTKTHRILQLSENLKTNS